MSLIFGLPAILSAVFAFLIHRQVVTPSGDKLGEVVERTHDISSAGLALTTQMHETIRNGRPD